MDIDKEEAALRSGIERSALALKSRLEQPLMMKDDSIDSTETGPSSDSCSASACTTQPLGMLDSFFFWIILSLSFLCNVCLKQNHSNNSCIF